MTFHARPDPDAGLQVMPLPDGRLHLHQGPIDLILSIDGEAGAVAAARGRAVARFRGMLAGLVAELPALRSAGPCCLTGPVARAMAAAVAPHRPAFITPMAAVAGAVADAVLAVVPAPGIVRAHANNGGDIALHLTPGTGTTAALAGTGWTVRIDAAMPVRGIATSGWRGRSWSLGIADAVTVLARTAACADAAATMIANAVALPGHPAIIRTPASGMQADSDLGGRLVTIAVGPLFPADRALALDAGAIHAQGLLDRGIIAGAALFLQADARIVGDLRPMAE